jgi:hypothetical protein
MKRLFPVIVAVIGLSMAFIQPADGGCNGKGGGRGQGSAGGGCAAVVNAHFETLPVEELSDAERASVIRLRQDEKFARDVYTVFSEKWDLPIFGNLARAEQRHYDFVGLLIERYELEDPVVDETPGVFADPELGRLYTEFVARGEASMEGAFRAGATFEDLDLADIEEMIDASDNADILLVANNLAKGSRNHLRAFSKMLDRHGYEGYSAQYLTQGRVDEIIASDHERRVVYDEKGEALDVARGGGAGKAGGRGACKGKGRGQGNGSGQGKGCCKGAGTSPGTT